MKLSVRHIIAATLVCAVASAGTAFAQKPFNSIHEPLTPSMATHREMDGMIQQERQNNIINILGGHSYAM